MDTKGLNIGMDEQQKPAIILSSGGLDSTTAMGIAANLGFSLYSLSFDYGQRHRHELSAAKSIAQRFKVIRHLVNRIDLRQIGGSALTDDIDVPDYEEKKTNFIPVTYVPARNTIFLSYALAWAEVLGCADIFIGVNAVDYSGYPDCRPEYIKAFEKMANLALKATVEGKFRITVHTPLIRMSKAEIILKGLELGVDYSLTQSCYNPMEEMACGKCDSCVIRKKGFREAGVNDPTRYQP
jgi:7-cyano-7-deazaguanine synthase